MDLRLASLHLQGFKSHVNTSVEFTPGLNVITGPNAKGKSNLLRALLFCLGGTSHVPGGSKTLVNNRCVKVCVTATFVGESDVEICRTKSTATVKVNGELVAKGTSPVNKYIETHILGMLIF